MFLSIGHIFTLQLFHLPGLQNSQGSRVATAGSVLHLAFVYPVLSNTKRARRQIKDIFVTITTSVETFITTTGK